MRQSTALTSRDLAQAASRFLRDERGATAVEYALLASLIGVAIIVATQTLGQKIRDVFTSITGRLNTA